MKKIFSFLWDNILFLETLFLLIFIPLFPKIPIIDIRNTWVYIRAEDFVVFFVILSWIILLLKRKISLKTPLTVPILIFWAIGAVATLHGILLIFPTIADAHPNVAFLSLLRHIEYLSVFFIAFWGIRNKRQLNIVIAALVITLIGVIGYGFGQKYLGLPAFLTMNEEFAKGIPIQLSALSRVPSTFAGHYDLAAYLVLIIPLIVSLAFGFKNWILKIGLLGVSFLAFILLFMTVSRVSFFVLFIALLFVFFFQKRKLVFLSIPLLFLFAIALLLFQPTLLDRFKGTVSEVDVVVDAKTGESLGHVRFVSKDYFKDKLILQRRVKNNTELAAAITGEDPEEYSTSSAIVPFKFVPEEVPLVTAVNISTGENLPQGTGYTNLYLSPVTRRIGNFYYELPPNAEFRASPSAQVLVLHGDYIVKRASAYDLSFTTRFQGEWPRAIDAFKRNVLFGSGYGSVSLAVDNNYLRILGEIGLLGFIAYFVLFLCLGIYMRKVYPDIDSPLVRSFIVGFGAGVVGLSLNAILIDVFEASKIAFLLWTLFGITIGVLALYQKREVNLALELKKIAFSNYAIIFYLLAFSILLLSPIINHYFVGDDFTWLRWAADCGDRCAPLVRAFDYFTSADGFFYRPGTKIYFYLMYEAFWLNQVVYHLVSLLLNFAVASLFFLLANKILRNKLLAAGGAFMFLALSGATETVFWIASVGHLFAAVFSLLALLSFVYWEEKRKVYLYILSFVSICLALLFHEFAVVAPLLIIAYGLVFGNLNIRQLPKRFDYLALFIPNASYLVMRMMAQSHWFSGDYNYDLIKLPFNFAGNALGYILLTILGPQALPLVDKIREITRENILIAAVALPLVLVVFYLAYRLTKNVFTPAEKKVIVFGFLFFVISLLPFLGLGNITSRYSYLASAGLILIAVVVVKKIYEYLLQSGREIAVGAVLIVVIVFALFHIIQVQQTYYEWQEAGNKARKFFISFEGLYNNYWSKDDVVFHLVDVPIKVGNAWVFPVGLEDAVWFAFRNDKAQIRTYNNLVPALESAGRSLTQPVLLFRPDGRVVEVDRLREEGPVVMEDDKVYIINPMGELIEQAATESSSQ